MFYYFKNFIFSCYKVIILKFSYSHAIGCKNGNSYSFYEDYYRVDTYKKIYNNKIYFLWKVNNIGYDENMIISYNHRET